MVVSPSVLVTWRSAFVAIVVLSVPVLLVASGSVVELEAVALFVRRPGVGTAGVGYATLTVTVAPLAIVPKAQLKSEPLTAGVQVRSEERRVGKARRLGSQVSLRPTAWASDGPAFLTVIV